MGARRTGSEQVWLCFHTPGRDRDAERDTATATASCSSTRRSHAARLSRARGARDLEEAGEYRLELRVRDGFQSTSLDRHPFDVVGWDGYVWPYTFNADDFEPHTGRFHLPPAHPPDLPGAELRDLHVRAADARLGPDRRAAALPPLEHPIRGGDVLRRRRLRGAQGRRRRLPHPASLWSPARSSAGHRRARAGRPSDRRAGGHVGHVQAAEADARCGATTTMPTTPIRGTRIAPGSTPSRPRIGRGRPLDHHGHRAVEREPRRAARTGQRTRHP